MIANDASWVFLFKIGQLIFAGSHVLLKSLSVLLLHVLMHFASRRRLQHRDAPVVALVRAGLPWVLVSLVHTRLRLWHHVARWLHWAGSKP